MPRRIIEHKSPQWGGLPKRQDNPALIASTWAIDRPDLSGLCGAPSEAQSHQSPQLLQRMRTQPDTAGHLLNIYIEPSVPANARSQGGYASKTAAAEVDMLRLFARAPSIG